MTDSFKGTTMTVQTDAAFQQMVDLLPQIIWASDAVGNLAYVNSQWTQYTGLSQEQSVGSRPTELIHPDDRSYVMNAWQAAVEAGRNFETEMRLRRVDGEYEWFLCRCLPIFSEHSPRKRIVRWIGTSTNINRRKRAEENQTFACDLVIALRRMREPNAIAHTLVRGMGEYLNLPICVLLTYNNATGQAQLLATFNATGRGETGHNETGRGDGVNPVSDPTSSIGNTILLSPEQWQEIGQVLSTRLERAEAPLALAELTGIHEFEGWTLQSVTPDAPTLNNGQLASLTDGELAGGAVRPAALIAVKAAVAWQGDQNASVFLVGMHTAPHRWRSYEQNLFQTLTGSAWLAYQRAVTEADLRRQKEAFEFALETAAMGTWEYDFASRTIARSVSLDRIFGLDIATDDRAITDYQALIHEDDREKVTAAAEVAHAGEGRFDVEFRILRPGGEVRWLAGRGAVVRDPEAPAARLSGAVVDITSRKALETEIQARAELAQFQAAVGTVLTGGEDLRHLLQKVTEALVDTIGAAFARIWTLDEKNQMLQLQASAGEYTHLDGAHSRVPVGKYKIGRIARDGVPHLTNDVLHDPLVRDREWARREGMIAFAGYPLRIEGHVVGVMAMFARHALSARDLQAMAAVANKVALTIERKHVESSLRDSEERFRLALNDSPITVYTTNRDLKYTWVYNSPSRFEDKEMLGKRDDEIYTAAGAEELLRFKREVLASRQLMRRVVEVADEQDYARYDITAVPMFDEHGNPSGLTVAAADITERERAETRLAFLAEASELLTGSLDYNETLERLAQAIVPQLANWCAVDLIEDGELNQVVVAHENPEMVQWAHELRNKYPPQMDAPQGVAEVIRSGRPEFYPHISQEMLMAGARDEEHKEIIRQLGTRSAIVVPLRLRERILGALTLVWSDSRRNYSEADLRFAEELARRAAVAIENARLYREARTAESKLRTLNESLEQRVADRTAELERSNQELDRFAYVASHDLKAPLRAIDHLANWVADDAGDVLPAASVEHLTKMRGRIVRMEALLDDLLTYSRAGRVRGDASVVDTRELLCAVIETVSPPEGFHITLPDALPQLETYRAPFEAVFRNLFGNAIKHHPRRNGHIEITFEDMGDWVEFCVRDDGDGIRPEFHERIFEMFQTLRPRDQVEGSGIGLAVVKKIIESGGGTIRVESAPGAGATFCFTWPKIWRG
ncbi:MAG: GAF domain-containing protein [Litorilinea sp.]